MNDISPRRRLWPTVGLLLITAAALGGCLLLAGYLYLPALVTRWLPVAQIQRLGFTDFTGRITGIGLRRTTAGPFVFGTADQPALAIGSITLDYTPEGLRRKKIERLRIRDVVVNASLGPGGVSFPGLDSSALAKTVTARQTPAGEPSALAAITLEKLEIRNGLINLVWRNATHIIPFEAELTPDGRIMTGLDARVNLFPRGQTLVVAARVDLKKRKGRLRIDGTMIDMDRFSDLFHLIPDLDATGNVSVQANAGLTLAPVAIVDAAVDLIWHSGGLTCASVMMEPGQAGAPAIVTANSENIRTWQIKAGGFQLQSPVPVTLGVMGATVNLDSEMQTVVGNAELTILPFSLEHPTPIASMVAVPLPLAFDATRKASGAWTAGFKTIQKKAAPPSNPLALSVAGADIHTTPPHFNCTARGNNQKGLANWQLDLKPIRATAAGTIVKLPSAEATGQLEIKDGPLGMAWSGDARIQIPSPTLDGNGMAGKLDALTASARWQKRGSDPPAVDARIQFANGWFHHPASGLLLSGGRLDLPYRSSTGKAARPGTFSVARVVHDQRVYGTIQGRVTQEKDAYAFTATHASDLLPGMTAAFKGVVRTHGPHFPDADLNFRIPTFELPAETDLEQFVPTAKGVILAGTVSAQGKASLSSSGLDGDMDLAIKAGELRVAEKKITVEGIDATLHFPELPRIRSGPAQPIRFARAAMGGIVVDGGSFDVQVESEKTLFVEKGRLSWCGGKVDAGSLRITADKDEYHVNLYCHRLGLSRILEQLGSVNARGTGTVNGRIPIVYRNGNIRFDDGFLFSTPGEGGRVRLTGTEILTRGIPAGTPQYAQVDLAREALKDYAYTWAKLGLASEGEDFVMRLQFDGKPVKPLPFVYNKQIGSFIRVEAGAKGSVFQGIGLDVNLRLPLNRLLQYKDIVNMIE